MAWSEITALGPEHYYASCDSTVLQPGTYRIGIHNFANATGRTATVQVAAALQGELGTKTLSVGPERGTFGDSSPITVFTVTVTLTGTSTFTASAE